MDKFLKEYDLFPEQITDKIKEELCKMCNADWENTCNILVEHKDMYLTAVSCILYNYC